MYIPFLYRIIIIYVACCNNILIRHSNAAVRSLGGIQNIEKISNKS